MLKPGWNKMSSNRKQKLGLKDLKNFKAFKSNPGDSYYEDLKDGQKKQPQESKSNSLKDGRLQTREDKKSSTEGKSEISQQVSPQKVQFQLNISPEDKLLFIKSIRGVVKLNDSNRYEHKPYEKQLTEIFKNKRLQAEGRVERTKKSLKDTKPKKARKNIAKIVDNYGHDFYLAPSIGHDVIKKLKQGHWAIESTLDLHGFTEDEAYERFERFMSSCVIHKVRCCMVIHGKGLGSKDGVPILKSAVMSWCRDRPSVAAFVPAPDSIGGDGALLILNKIS